MNISMIIVRKGNDFESKMVSADCSAVRAKFKAMPIPKGADEVYLIDSRSGLAKAKKNSRVVIEKPKKEKAPEQTPAEPETPETETETVDAPDFADDAPGLLDGIE